MALMVYEDLCYLLLADGDDVNTVCKLLSDCGGLTMRCILLCNGVRDFVSAFLASLNPLQQQLTRIPNDFTLLFVNSPTVSGYTGSFHVKINTGPKEYTCDVTTFVSYYMNPDDITTGHVSCNLSIKFTSVTLNTSYFGNVTVGELLNTTIAHMHKKYKITHLVIKVGEALENDKSYIIQSIVRHNQHSFTLMVNSAN